MKKETIEREEQLEFQLANSELVRLKSQIGMLEAQHQLLTNAVKPAEGKLEALTTALKEKYNIGASDTVDVSTGVITRGTEAASDE